MSMPVMNIREVRVSVGHRLVNVRMCMRLVEVRPGMMGIADGVRRGSAGGSESFARACARADASP